MQVLICLGFVVPSTLRSIGHDVLISLFDVVHARGTALQGPRQSRSAAQLKSESGCAGHPGADGNGNSNPGCSDSSPFLIPKIRPSPPSTRTAGLSQTKILR